MEVFQIIGIIVSALLIYAATTLFIAIIAPSCDEDECCTIAWIVGGVEFAVVLYCWITGVPFPQF